MDVVHRFSRQMNNISALVNQVLADFDILQAVYNLCYASVYLSSRALRLDIAILREVHDDLQ